MMFYLGIHPSTSKRNEKLAFEFLYKCTCIYILQLKNPTFVFLALAATTEALIIGGLATFGAKLLQQFFNIDLTKAGLTMGMISEWL